MSKSDEKITDANKIVVPITKGVAFVKYNELLRIQSDAGYCTLHLLNGESLLVSKTIKYFEEILDSKLFLRVHRSHIVNLGYVKQILTSDSTKIVLSGGAEIPISRRRKEKIEELVKMVLKQPNRCP